MTTLPALRTHMFWCYGPLSNLERVCCASFSAQGFDVQLWTYGDIPNAPAGVSLRDAREVLPESKVFLNRKGSYASFSDLFRYTVLNTQGGLYADTDVIALRQASQIPRAPFVVTERSRRRSAIEGVARKLLRRPANNQINNNVIYNPVPREGNLVDLALAIAERYRKEDISWGELGPNLLTGLAMISPAHGFDVHPPEFANPLGWWECPHRLLKKHSLELPHQAAFLHCFNESWRARGIDKNADFPLGSPMSHFVEKYLRR